MFAKYNEKLYNLNLLHVRLNLKECSIFLFESLEYPYSASFRYSEAKTASFAYYRILHGLMGKWGCVDVSPKAIGELMEKVEAGKDTTEEEEQP